MRDIAGYLCKWIRFREIGRCYLVCSVTDRLRMRRYDGVRIEVLRWLLCTERGFVCLTKEW